MLQGFGAHPVLCRAAANTLQRHWQRSRGRWCGLGMVWQVLGTAWHAERTFLAEPHSTHPAQLRTSSCLLHCFRD